MTDLTKINGIGKATVKKLDAEGIKTPADLAKADAKALAAKPGFGTEAEIAVWIAQAEKLAEADTEEHAKTLLGSSILPSEIEIAENVVVQLGDVVARAHRDSELDIEAWNALVDADREERLAQAVEAMKLEATIPPQTNTEGGDNADATVPASQGATDAAGEAKVETAQSAASAAPGGDSSQGTNTTQSDEPGGDSNPAVPAQAPAQGDTVRISVRGPKKGRWRAGMHFTREVRTVEVTNAQFEAIEADPVLSFTPPLKD